MVEEIVCQECKSELKRNRHLFFMAAVLGLVLAACMLFIQWGSLEERDSLARQYNACSYNLSTCMNKQVSFNHTNSNFTTANK